MVRCPTISRCAALCVIIWACHMKREWHAQSSYWSNKPVNAPASPGLVMLDIEGKQLSEADRKRLRSASLSCLPSMSSMTNPGDAGAFTGLLLQYDDCACHSLFM